MHHHRFSPTYHWLIIDFHQLITDSSSTHHDNQCSTTHHRLITWSSVFTDLSPTNHRLIIDASPIFTNSWLIFTKSSPNHHWLINDSSPTHYRFITDSSPIHHRLITDSSLKHNDHWFSPTHHRRIMNINLQWLITFCSDSILQRLHSAAMKFCTYNILQ